MGGFPYTQKKEEIMNTAVILFMFITIIITSQIYTAMGRSGGAQHKPVAGLGEAVRG